MTTTDDLILVVQKRSDALLLRRLLQRALSISPQFYAGGARSTLVTLARNILVHEGGPVFVVLDARTVDSDAADEACGLTRMALGYVASEDVFDAFSFRPQLDVVFFEAPGVLRRYAAGVHELEMELGRYNSTATLERILARDGRTPESFYRALNDPDLDELLAGPQLSGFTRAVEELMARTAVALSR